MRYAITMDPVAAKAETLSNRASLLAGLWRTGFTLLVVIWLGWLIINSDFPAGLDELLTDYRSWLFVVGWAVIPIGLGLLWRWQLRVTSGLSLSLPVTLKIQALAWAGRYLPGKAGLWIAKIALVRRGNVSAVMLTSTVLLEQLLFLVTGMLVAIIAFAWQMDASLQLLSTQLGRWQGAHVLLWAVLGWSLLALLVVTMYRKAYVKAYLEKIIAQLPPRSAWPSLVLGLVLGHVALHVVVGISLYPLLTALCPDAAALLGLTGVVGVLALANTAGILAVFAPAGLGVRELVLAYFLAVDGDYETALVVAVYIRVLSMLADVAFSVLAGSVGMLLDRSTLPLEPDS